MQIWKNTGFCIWPLVSVVRGFALPPVAR